MRTATPIVRGGEEYGLAHVLLIRCNFSDCGVLNEVPTGSKHKAGNGRTVWVDTKLAVVMVNGGYGKTHLNTLLAALNIYCVSQKTLKTREREVGQQVGEMAEETCQKSLQEEIRSLRVKGVYQPALMVPGKNGVLDEPIIV